MAYILITVSEDGDVRIHGFDKDKVIQGLKDHGLKPDTMWDGVPTKSDIMEWGNKNALLVKGEVVVPKPITTVTEYEVP